MNSNERNFLTNHPALIKALKEGLSTPTGLASRLQVSLPTIFNYIKEGKNCGALISDAKGQNIGIKNYYFEAKIIRSTDLFSIKYQIIDALKTSSSKVPLSTVFVVDCQVSDNDKNINIIDGNGSLIVNSYPLTQNDFLIVNSDTIRLIYLRNFVSTNKNIVYYNILKRQFAVIEDNILKERLHDADYGKLPLVDDYDISLLDKLNELLYDEYDIFYQANKEKLFNTIGNDILAILFFLRPDKIYLDSNVIKPQYINRSNVYQDIDHFIFSKILGNYNSYYRNIHVVNFNENGMLEAAQFYLQHKFFSWNICW